MVDSENQKKFLFGKYSGLQLKYHFFRTEIANLINQFITNNSSSSLAATRNPFEQHPPNPFQAAAKNQKPAMNELLQQQTSPWQAQQPQQPQQQNQQNQQGDFNPFF